MFNDKKERASLFVDFVKKSEDMDEIRLVQTRRNIKRKLASAVYRPKTHAELMEKWKDADYVALIEQDSNALAYPDPPSNKNEFKSMSNNIKQYNRINKNNYLHKASENVFPEWGGTM